MGERKRKRKRNKNTHTHAHTRGYAGRGRCTKYKWRKIRRQETENHELQRGKKRRKGIIRRRPIPSEERGTDAIKEGRWSHLVMAREKEIR